MIRRLGILTVVSSIVVMSSVASVDATPPNFIVFVADDMAWDDAGAYGHPHIKTPNIDRLAKEGLRFDNAYLTCSSCSPSRASIMTGRYPHNTGGAHQLHNPLSGDQVVFPELLKEAGYYTASAGKWHLGKETEPKFDRVVTKMNQWVKTLKGRPKSQPFFMWFAFSDPHRGYQQNTIEEPHEPDDVVVPPYLPDTEETREDLALYYDEIARLDGVVGDVRKELKRQRVTEDTVIIFLSDNGRPFPRCKTTCYTSGVKTPFIVTWPGQIDPGTTDSLVSAIDIGPTLLGLAAVEPGDTFTGVSFRPILKDPTASVRDYAFAEHNWHDFDDYQRAVRDKNYNYIRTWYTDVPNTPPADAVKSITYQKTHELRETGQLTDAQLNPYVTPRPEEELFDVQADPHELNNLIDDPQYAATLNRMRRILDDWQIQTDDQIPETRRPDEFDRTTGDRLPAFQKKRKK